MRNNPIIPTILLIYAAFSLACFVTPSSTEDDDDPEINPSNPNQNPTNPNQDPTNPSQNPSNEQLNVQGQIKTDTTWRGTVFVHGDVTISDNVNFTVEQGTEIIMCADCTLDLGYFSSAGSTINFNGTPEYPITIRGQQTNAGYWKGVHFGEKTTSNSALKYVQIKHAGAAQTPALTLDTGVLIDHLTIEDVADDAIHATGFKAGSTDLTVRRAAGHPALLKHHSAVYNFPANDKLEDANATIALDFYYIEGVGTFRALSAPYYSPKGLALGQDAALTIDPGATFIMASDTLADFAYFDTPATLHIKGTKEQPVTFQGKDPAPGSWKGIRFSQELRSASTIEHLIVRHGGGADGEHGAINNESKALFKDITVEAAKGYGIITTEHARFKEGSANLTVNGATKRPLRIQAAALLSLPQTTDLTQNADPRIEVHGAHITSTGTIHNYGVPLYAIDGLTISEGNTLTIKPGVRIEFGTDQTFSLGYFTDSTTFNLEGTEQDPIILTGADASPGAWNGVFVNSQTKTSSTLRHVHILYGGQPDGAALTLAKGITVEDCRIEDSAGFGLALQNDAVAKRAAYAAKNTLANNAKGNISD